MRMLALSSSIADELSLKEMDTFTEMFISFFDTKGIAARTRYLLYNLTWYDMIYLVEEYRIFSNFTFYKFDSGEYCLRYFSRMNYKSDVIIMRNIIKKYQEANMYGI